MNRIRLLLPTGMAILRAAVEANNSLSRRDAVPSLVPGGAQNPATSRLCSFPVLFFAAAAALWGTTAMAQQTHTIYTQPKFLWQFYNVQVCGYCSGGPYPFETSLALAWSDAQSLVDQTSDNSIWTAENLIATPGTLTFDGIPYQNEFGVQSCDVSGGGCSYSPNVGYIQTGYTCPVNSHVVNNTPSGSGNEILQCAITVTDILPPKTCLKFSTATSSNRDYHFSSTPA